ncbi:hypothetical protein Tco_0226680 [Tanacetum coccineum]
MNENVTNTLHQANKHDNVVDRSVAALNHHPTADIHVHDCEFADDYMSVLNEEEHEEKHDAKYSLDEMNLIYEDKRLLSLKISHNKRHDPEVGED